ncbi:MAG: 5'/3'-nucleotidase SurE [Polyangiales bacterium]
MSHSMLRSAFALACALTCAQAAPAHALNILLTNDDGFEAASLHAVYQRLTASGHSVIISAPALDGTAQGGGLTIGRAVEALPTASRGGAVPAGSPGLGTLPTDANVHYVNGTPVMSVLYALDIVSKQKWGKAPDLVVSGINYGLNVGRLWSGSGTVGAALSAIQRGVPAIAVSADYPLSSYTAVSGLQPGAREYDLADFVVRLVRAVEASRSSASQPLLPRNIGLNVSLPVFTPGTAATLPVKHTKTGEAVNYASVFVMNMARDWAPTLPAAPGVAFYSVNLLPLGVTRESDNDARSEYNVVKLGQAAISVVQATIQPTPWSPDALGDRIVARMAPPPPPVTPPPSTPAPAAPTTPSPTAPAPTPASASK